MFGLDLFFLFKAVDLLFSRRFLSDHLSPADLKGFYSGL